VSSVGQSLDVQLEKLKECDKVFKEKRSGLDSGRPALKQCLGFLREGDTLLVTKIDRLARSTSDLYRIIATHWQTRASVSGLSTIRRSTPPPALASWLWASWR
jgi:Resolvase, N terminal domain